MTPSAPILRTVSTTASAAVLALALGLFPSGPALAATADPSPTAGTQAPPDCGLVCVPILADNPDPGRPRKSKEAAQPPAQPAPPAEPPAQPLQPQPTEPAAQPQAGTPEPAGPPATAAELPGGAATGTTSPAAGYRPPTGPSSGVDWNSPVNRTAGPARMAAAAAPARDEGPGGPALLPIALGTLLVGVSAGAFAWWNRNRNRLRSH